MRIGLVTARAAEEFEGGSERFVRALARGLFAAGHDVRVVAGTDGRAAAEVLRESSFGVPLARIPLRDGESFAAGLDRPRVDRLVAGLLEGCEVVHVHHWATLSQRLVRTLAPRARVVVTLHDAFASCPRFFRRSPRGERCPPRGEFDACGRCLDPGHAVELVPRLAARARDFEAELAAAERWIAPSAFHARRMTSLLGLDPGRGLVLAPGLTRRVPRGRPSRGAPGLLRVLHFGNLGEEKGTYDLVQAMATLGDGRASLTLAGRALDPDFDARVERLRGSLPVRRVPTYDGATLGRLAAESDLAVFPSRLPESYGLVLDEAHAAGLPVWTSDQGAFPERLAAGERALPAGDVAAWAAALSELARDPAPLCAVRRRFEGLHVPGVEESVRAHAELYASLLARRAVEAPHLGDEPRAGAARRSGEARR